MLLQESSTIVSITAMVFGVGIFLYLFAIGLALLFDLKYLSHFRSMLERNISLNVGVPASAVGAFGLVSVFWSAFPQHGINNAPLELEFMSLQFSGPSGPITLWVLCFLSLVFAMFLLKNKSP